ncbi:GroES-like protein [Thelephora ganbajun]|uniref:GroES-like protein n=1 Tax=Thelephora ganbajun TaxID=370292 RepID=A0ACB6ZKU6_THEGA|nr:GroES-like protein [Thelephora ganbajun]
MSAPTGNIPVTCKTLVQEEEGIVLKETPIPEVGENEVLIKVRAIGLNPIDVSGCDLTGEVVKLGPNLKVDIRVGDRVSATVVGNSASGRGAFTEYAKAFSDLVWKIPQGTLSFEHAVAIGSPLNAAFQALYGVDDLGLTQRFDSAAQGWKDETWVFIYGGSSGVGQFAIQLAKLSGYKVVTVASPRNHDFLKALGADAVFDYKDPDVVQKVKDVAGNKISHVLDAISGNDTQFTSLKVLAEDKPGKLVTVLPHAEGIQDVRKDVQITMITIFTSYGFGFGGKDADEYARRALSAFLQKVPGLVKDKKLKHIPVKEFDGGLEKVVSDGFEYITKGKVSAEKIVFTVAYQGLQDGHADPYSHG